MITTNSRNDNPLFLFRNRLSISINLGNASLIKCFLKQLVVVPEFLLVLCLELHLAHVEGSWEQPVHELAVSGT